MWPLGERRIALRMRGVSKSFAGVAALREVDLEVVEGEVHALLGENGAGKSTLMKVLSGAHRPDAGDLELFEVPFAPRSPSDALRRGVAMIYQELNLAPHLTVAQNVMLGQERARFGVLQGQASRVVVERVLQRLGAAEIAPGTRVAALGAGARQLVEIARALACDARVLVMDEPTTSLSRAETERLFEVVRRLRAGGVAIVYISHFLEEVQEIGDRYTVLRDGRTVAAGAVRDATVATWIEQMTGRPAAAPGARPARTPGDVALSVRGLAGRRLPRGATLTLHYGEVLGIAGLVGSGRTELLRCIFGLDDVVAGELTLGEAGERAASVSLLSEDRTTEGLALGMSLADNVTLPRLRRYAISGWIDRAAQRAAAAEHLNALGVRYRSVLQAARDLSGGNQQKVAFARLLDQSSRVLLLDEPTRGIDVASRADIHRLIGELAARGDAVLVVSSYVPELLAICDRIAVMHRGRLGAARDVASWSEAELLEASARGGQ